MSVVSLRISQVVVSRCCALLGDGALCAVEPFKDKVKVTFARGPRSTIPTLFNAGFGGSKWRAIDLHEGDKPDAPRSRPWCGR